MIPQTLIDRTKFLVGRMRDLCGVDAMQDTRKKEVVTCRVLISQELVNEGWPDEQIGEAIGRDRTTVIHYHRRFADITTMICFASDYELWKKFYNSIIDMNKEEIEILHRLEDRKADVIRCLSNMNDWGRRLYELSEKGGKFYVQIVCQNGNGICLQREITREDVEMEYNAELKRLNDEKERIEKEIEEL